MKKKSKKVDRETVINSIVSLRQDEWMHLCKTNPALVCNQLIYSELDELAVMSDNQLLKTLNKMKSNQTLKNYYYET